MADSKENKSNILTPKLPYRYPGTKPFTGGQTNLFYGRKQDVENLYEMLLEKKVVTMYSESGMGKSSLINAGLLPEFEKKAGNQQGFSLIKIRFGAYLAEKNNAGQPATNNHLLDVLVYELRQGARGFTQPVPYIQEHAAHIIWYLVKYYERNGRRLLIIFDQGEELFTYPVEMVDEFKRQLGCITNPHIPQVYDEEISRLVAGLGHNKAANQPVPSPVQIEHDLKFFYQQVNALVLFVIKSDNLGMLKSFENYFPNVLKDTFQLCALKKDGATEAITRPADEPGNYMSGRFEYTAPAVEKLLDNLRERSGLFDPFSIQLNCRYVERALALQGMVEINATDIPDNAKAVNDFLENTWLLLKPYLQTDIQDFKKVLEEKLIDLDSRRRVSASDGTWLDRKVKAILIEEGLIKEDSWGGVTYIELSHDRLVEPLLEDYAKIREYEQKDIIKKQNKQLEKERQRLKKIEKLKDEASAAEVKAKEAEKKARDYAKEAKDAERLALMNEQKARKHLRYAVWALGLIIVMGAILAYYFAQVQQQKNKYQQLLATNLLSNSDKAYNEGNHRLAFLFALYADSIAGGHQADSLADKKQLAEFSAAGLQASSGGEFIATLNDSLQITHMVNWNAQKNPSALLRNIKDFRMSEDGHTIAVVDTAGNKVKTFAVNVKGNSALTLDPLATINDSIGDLTYNKAIVAKGYFLSFSRDTVKLYELYSNKVHYITIPPLLRGYLYDYAFDKESLFLFRYDKGELMKAPLHTDGSFTPVADLVPGYNTEFYYLQSSLRIQSFLNKKDNIIYRFVGDSLVPYINLGTTKVGNSKSVTAIKEAPSFYLVSFRDPYNTFGKEQVVFVPRNTAGALPLADKGMVFKNVDRLVLNSGDSMMLLRNDTLIMYHQKKGVYYLPIKHKDSVVIAKMGSAFYYSPSENIIYCGERDSYGFIKLQNNQAVFQENNQLTGSFYPLWKDWFCFPGNNTVSKLTSQTKDVAYWLSFYGDLTPQEKKLYGIE